MTTNLKVPRKPMAFTVLEVTKMSKITVKVTPPFIWHRNKHFKDLDDFLEQTEEFIKAYSYEECYLWKVEIESKVVWHRKLPEMLLQAVEKRFFDELFKEAEQR